MRGWLLALGLCLTGITGGTPPVAAQTVQSPVLVIETERAFAQSAFGRQLQARIEQDGQALEQENSAIEAELTEEERALTVQRDMLSAEAFRALADAFDEKVQTLRRQQDDKVSALATRREEAERAFLTAAQPVLTRIMAESGAAVILDKRTVFVVADAVDITDLAIARINAAFEQGHVSLPEPPSDTPEGSADPQSP